MSKHAPDTIDHREQGVHRQMRFGAQQRSLADICSDGIQQDEREDILLAARTLPKAAVARIIGKLLREQVAALEEELFHDDASVRKERRRYTEIGDLIRDLYTIDQGKRPVEQPERPLAARAS